MKAWVREKLNQIAELYPEQRLAESRARWRAVWAGAPPKDRYPYVWNPMGFNYYNTVYAKEEGLRAYLDEIVGRGFLQDDFIPAFFPGCKQSTIPCMFGAQEVVLGGDYSTKRLLHSYEDIDRLPAPTFSPGTPAALWLQMEEYYLGECEGRLPVHVCDMQGPMDVAGQLIGYDQLFLSAFDDEERFHRLLRICCDAFIVLWNAQKELLGERFVATHLFGWDWALQDGASLSADSMAMVSGAFFAEHYSRHLQYIADALGPLSVHSCGNFSATAAPLGRLPCVRAANASQMSVEALLDAGWDAGKMIILLADPGSAKAMFDMARNRGLRLDVSFVWQAPRGEGGPVPPARWTKEQREAMRRADEAVAAAARA